MKTSLDTSVLSLTDEDITNFTSLNEFDKKIIQFLSNICKNSTLFVGASTTNDIGAESAIAGAGISFILVSKIITSINTAKRHESIVRIVTFHNISYSSVLATLKIENKSFLYLKDEVEPKAPEINNRDNGRNIFH